MTKNSTERIDIHPRHQATLGEVIAQAAYDGEENRCPSRPVLLVALPEVLVAVEPEAHELGPHRVNRCLEPALSNRGDGRHRFPQTSYASQDQPGRNQSDAAFDYSQNAGAQYDGTSFHVT